jgi:phosphoglycerate dehydrogenase-like enzyme
MKRILLIGGPDERFDAHQLAARLAPKFPGLELVGSNDTADAVGQAAGAEGMIGFGHHYSEALLAAAPRLRWVQSLTTGVDAILKLEALRPDVLVTNTAGLHAPQMSELAFLHMIALSRNYPKILDNQRAERWERYPQPLLYRKTVVILGVGAIALGLAKRCKAFEMTVIGVSGTPRTAEGFDRMMSRAELRQAAALADYFIALIPLTPESRHIVDAGVFAAMKRSAYFINLARGGVCDEEALLAALRQGRIAGAGLDVFQNDPLPPGHPLWSAPNTLITPRIGGLSDIYLEQCIPYLEANLGCVADDRWNSLVNVVKH